MEKIVFQIVSILSIVVALPLFFDFYLEIKEGMKFSEIMFLPFLILFMVIINFVISSLYLIKPILYSKNILIIQTIILIINMFVDYQIYFNSTIVCT